MVIQLNVKDFEWKKEKQGIIIGELTLNKHPKFPLGFIPSKTTLTIDNTETNNYGVFVWSQLTQNPDYSAHHIYFCREIRALNNVKGLPSPSHIFVKLIRA